MNRSFLLLLFVFAFGNLRAQELYIFSEPASNMPAKSLAAKIGFKSPDSKYNNYFKQRYLPELMLGLSKNWMIHVSTSFSDYYSNSIRWESVKTYLKYRFYSDDDVHRHFRLAAFAEGAYSRNPFLYDEINLDGDNSGVQGGLIATGLTGKFAMSATTSVIKVFADRMEHIHHEGHSLEALNYSVSAGYLLFPRSYTGYGQTNLNLYLEAIGMKGFSGSDYMLDLAPGLQVIFNSNFKVNIGARLQVTGNMTRVGENTFYLGLERTFLGALKKKKKTE
ncbi:MAG: hypothetical protein H7Y27_02580 [Gemmatimonadaceae bacterium]|nr:hypothetical protein [Chitinophagaceae bacterium]